MSTLNAIDLNIGEYVWGIPLGYYYPALAVLGRRNTSTENYGGPIVTAGGLIFIEAMKFNQQFRAFDKVTAMADNIVFAGTSTRATYEVGGRQYVVIVAEGKNRSSPSDGVYVAFSLRQ